MPAPESIKLSVQLEQNDLRRANIDASWSRSNLIKWSIFIASMAFLSGLSFKLAFSSLTQDFGLWPGVLFGILFAPAFMVTMVYWSAHKSAKESARRAPAFQGPTLWTFSESGILTDGPTARAELQWKALLRVQETKTQFLLYPQTQIAYVIPKRFFQSGSQIEGFRELVRRIIPGSSLKGC